MISTFRRDPVHARVREHAGHVREDLDAPHAGDKIRETARGYRSQR